MPNIIIPGGVGSEPIISGSPTEETFLQKGEYLGEFESQSDKAKARLNLGVKSEEDIDSKFIEIENLTSQLTEKLTLHLLDLEDPHNTLSELINELSEYVKKDGSIPFTKPQSGVSPVTESHLTTKKYVDDTIKKLFKEYNIESNQTLYDSILLHLSQYAKNTDVYNKKSTYSKEEINDAFNEVILKNGSVPFISPVSGKDPISDSHLSTKRYVDKKFREHLSTEDPHGVKVWVLDVLKDYALKRNVSDVNELTVRRYAEIRVLELLNDLSLLTNPLNLSNKLDIWGYVKKDGTTKFISPQGGVDAVDEDHLVTLRQLNTLLSESTKELSDKLSKVQSIADGRGMWYTEGPVETTVGFVEDNTLLPEELSLQLIMDLIFYGKGVIIDVPEFAEPGTKVLVCLKTKGSPKRLKTIVLKQGDVIIWQGTGDDFEDTGEVCIESNELVDDPTVWTVEIEYLKGSDTVTAQTSLVGASFFGILDMFNWASGILYSDYLRLAEEDPVNIKKVVNKSSESVTISMNFESYTNPKQIFAAVPMNHPDLQKLITPAQSFNVSSGGWNIVLSIPLDINGHTVMYKVYVYKELITALDNEEITFKF